MSCVIGTNIVNDGLVLYLDAANPKSYPGSGTVWKDLSSNKIDFNLKRNLLIASVILVVGIGGLTFEAGPVALSGMALATLFGIILNLVLPQQAKSEAE